MKKHILLIDDDKDELTIFLDALREVPDGDGFKCTFANSSLNAVEMLKFLVPDFIFIDLNIPRMNGLEFINFVRKQPHLAKTHFCLYSIHINEETERIAGSLGATCIQKTGTIDELVKELKALFS